VDVPYPVARALQKKYSFAINETALDKAIEKAKTVRSTADSLKAQTAPPAATPPAGTPPDTAAKK